MPDWPLDPPLPRRRRCWHMAAVVHLCLKLGTPRVPETWHSGSARNLALRECQKLGTPGEPETWHSGSARNLALRECQKLGTLGVPETRHSGSAKNLVPGVPETCSVLKFWLSQSSENLQAEEPGTEPLRATLNLCASPKLKAKSVRPPSNDKERSSRISRDSSNSVIAPEPDQVKDAKTLRSLPSRVLQYFDFHGCY